MTARELTIRATMLGAVAAIMPMTASADAMSDARAVLDAHRAAPDFAPLGEPFDAAACMADKSVFSIPVTMAIPFNVELQKAMSRAAADVGFKYTTWENQGASDSWIQGVNQAIAQDYSLVDVAGGLNPEMLAPQLREAKEAGLAVTTTHLYDESQEQADFVDASAKVDYRRAGEILAAWAFVETEGKPNVLIIGSDDVLPSLPFVEQIRQSLSEYCPDCEQQYLNVPVNEWATRIQSGTQSALLANPGINYILPIYDSMTQFVTPALRIAGANDVGMASYNGTPFVLDMVREGTVQMDIGESLGWAGYAAVDAQMRVLCGLEVPESLGIPLLIFDKDNAETAGVPADFDSGYGDAHVAGYRKLWGLEG
ncbi:substrate-binding domain-containing protein [Paracoccus sp. 1_MG-2023]|uniref:sugar ABC transporter substrate-binding protein n=1 Tax=unclassified Paracoccus (in: a-proteobacteria) TaxID=2688777 RepID=UPI001C08E1C7|nr:MULTISPECIES: substrate-binding domain-containing protein [unclassified Paracoccus (in: a-proteobacteria)]MBU2957640.1 substrate-binding domain-containing protein [Paracoccus sp. C2R09]MDO6667513.1 substrate-binding domain-containing protein [Paracoccus sp. 1_MG-2023]